MSQKPVQNYIPALTGVRAMAAYLVFISHYEYLFDANFPHTVQRFLQEFHIGVTIFFVLSGFLIAFRYYDTFQLTKDWFKQYLKNRVARIYPMYFLLTICTFIYYYCTHDKAIVGDFPSPFGLLLLHITFLRGFFYDLVFTGIGPGWSLTVEECFYFTAPIAFFISQQYKKFYIQPFIITAFGFLLVLLFRNVNWYGFFGSFTFMMLYTFLGRSFEFFVGIQLALIMRRKGFDRSSKFNFTYFGFLMIFVCVWLMSILTIPRGWNAGLQNPAGIVINNYLLACSIGMFFYGLLTESTVIKNILARPFVELLGKSSYIFYLIHLTFIYTYINKSFNWLNDWFFNQYDKWGVDWASPFQYDALNILLAFIVLNGVSVFLFKNIEEPLNHYIRKSNFLIEYKPKKNVDTVV